ncbi:hypothetical protein DIPPA_14756 [Diplonema papillatum]|nr:hypothetical protein DIPPA_14756 [Diplonema papillatum]
MSAREHEARLKVKDAAEAVRALPGTARKAMVRLMRLEIERLEKGLVDEAVENARKGVHWTVNRSPRSTSRDRARRWTKGDDATLRSDNDGPGKPAEVLLVTSQDGKEQGRYERGPPAGKRESWFGVEGWVILWGGTQWMIGQREDPKAVTMWARTTNSTTECYPYNPSLKWEVCRALTGWTEDTSIAVTPLTPPSASPFPHPVLSHQYGTSPYNPSDYALKNAPATPLRPSFQTYDGASAVRQGSTPLTPTTPQAGANSQQEPATRSPYLTEARNIIRAVRGTSPRSFWPETSDSNLGRLASPASPDSAHDRLNSSGRVPSPVAHPYARGSSSTDVTSASTPLTPTTPQAGANSQEPATRSPYLTEARNIIRAVRGTSPRSFWPETSDSNLGRLASPASPDSAHDRLNSSGRVPSPASTPLTPTTPQAGANSQEPATRSPYLTEARNIIRAVRGTSPRSFWPETSDSNLGRLASPASPDSAHDRLNSSGRVPSPVAHPYARGSSSTRHLCRRQLVSFRPANRLVVDEVIQ